MGLADLAGEENPGDMSSDRAAVSSIGLGPNTACKHYKKYCCMLTVNRCQLLASRMLGEVGKKACTKISTPCH